MQQIAAKHEVHPNRVSTWKRQAAEGLEEVFAGGGSSCEADQEARSRPSRPCGGSVRNSVFGPPWPDPVGPTVLGHCSSSVRTGRPELAGADRDPSPGPRVRSDFHGLFTRAGASPGHPIAVYADSGSWPKGSVNLGNRRGWRTLVGLSNNRGPLLPSVLDDDPRSAWPRRGPRRGRRAAAGQALLHAPRHGPGRRPAADDAR